MKLNILFTLCAASTIIAAVMSSDWNTASWAFNSLIWCWCEYFARA